VHPRLLDEQAGVLDTHERGEALGGANGRELLVASLAVRLGTVVLPISRHVSGWYSGCPLFARFSYEDPPLEGSLCLLGRWSTVTRAV
jgi:hypothetical protein